MSETVRTSLAFIVFVIALYVCAMLFATSDI